MKKSYILAILLLLLPMQIMSQVRPTIAVLGDSYSTFEGFNPKGNAVWYFNPARKDMTDVTCVEQTWWWQVIKEGGYKRGVIDAYSGATICNRGYRGEDYTDRSFITRVPNLGNPDITLICGATNDSWANVKMGNYQYADWQRNNLFQFRPGMAKMLNDICLYYPNVKVYFVLNDGLSNDINTSVEKVCQHYHVPIIKLKNIDKKTGHPSVKGMKSIAKQVLKVLKKG